MNNKEYAEIRTALVPRVCEEIDTIMGTNGGRERDGDWSKRFLARMDELTAVAVNDFEKRWKAYEKRAKNMRAEILAETIKAHK